MLLERYHSKVSQQEEMLVSLCPLPADVSAQWIQRASAAVSGTVLRIQVTKDCMHFHNHDHQTSVYVYNTFLSIV